MTKLCNNRSYLMPQNHVWRYTLRLFSHLLVGRARRRLIHTFASEDNSECTSEYTTDDTSEDNLSGVVFSNERPESHESKGGFFNLEHYLRDHERRMSTPERPLPSRHESAVPEMPAVAVERDASASDDLAGNNAVCSTCPSPP